MVEADGTGAYDLFLVVWAVAVDVDEVDFGRVELRQQWLQGCRSGCEGSWDCGGGRVHVGGGLGERLGRSFSRFLSHDGLWPVGRRPMLLVLVIEKGDGSGMESCWTERKWLELLLRTHPNSK